MTDLSLDKLAGFVREGVPYRKIEVPVSRADERRVEAFNARYPSSSDLVPLGRDERLAWGLLSAAQFGLEQDEYEHGVWMGVDGVGNPLPRPREYRASRRVRLRVAWRAGRAKWRGL